MSKCLVCGEDRHPNRDCFRDAMHKAIKKLQQERDEALELLKRVYIAGHRHGWEGGESFSDVAAAINDYMAEATGDPNWSGYPRWEDGDDGS